MEEYENYISVALLLLLAILQPHRWKFFITVSFVIFYFFGITTDLGFSSHMYLSTVVLLRLIPRLLKNITIIRYLGRPLYS